MANRPGGIAEQEDRRRYLIQIERRGEKLTMEKIREILQIAGVELDEHYGPINVNPAMGRYVVRGWANALARAQAEKIPGVQFFSDPLISPLGPP